jgi:hypothetical protein
MKMIAIGILVVLYFAVSIAWELRDQKRNYCHVISRQLMPAKESFETSPGYVFKLRNNGMHITAVCKDLPGDNLCTHMETGQDYKIVGRLDFGENNYLTLKVGNGNALVSVTKEEESR